MNKDVKLKLKKIGIGLGGLAFLGLMLYTTNEVVKERNKERLKRYADAHRQLDKAEQERDWYENATNDCQDLKWLISQVSVDKIEYAHQKEIERMGKSCPECEKVDSANSTEKGKSSAMSRYEKAHRLMDEFKRGIFPNPTNDSQKAENVVREEMLKILKHAHERAATWNKTPCPLCWVKE